VPLSGPDWTALPSLDPAKIDFDSYIGAYDIHSYQGTDSLRQATLARWSDWAHSRNKPFFLSEFGDMRLGWRSDNPGPKSFAAVLSNAETVIRGLRIGVDAFNRWSFVNRGDLDGQWQLVRTWDSQTKRHLTEVVPETTAYYGVALQTRFLPKYSSRLADAVLATPLESEERILSVSLGSQKRNLTTLVLNLGNEGCQVHLTYLGLARPVTLFRYGPTEGKASSPSFPLAAEQSYRASSGKAIVTRVPGRSLTVFTTYKLGRPDPGIIKD
jgi:hypothetical protein